MSVRIERCARYIGLFVFIYSTTTRADFPRNQSVVPRRPHNTSAEAPSSGEGGRRSAKPGGLVTILQSRVDHIEWKDTPFAEIIEWVRDKGPINVIPIWRTLKSERVTPDTPVTLSMSGATVGEVLSASLEQLSDELRWRAIGRTLRISTRTDFPDDLYTVVYDLGDLMQDRPDFVLKDLHGSSFLLQQGREVKEQSTYSREKHMDMVRKLIIETVAPETWRGGGGPGSIELDYPSGAMVVCNSPEVHVMIGGSFDISEAVPAHTAPRSSSGQDRNRGVAVSP